MKKTDNLLFVWGLMTLKIRSYHSVDEEQWLKCHVMAYLGSNERRFLTEKPRYERPSIELVYVDDNDIIGFLDIELEDVPGSVCYKKVEGNAMLWDIGILKEYRRKGVATQLLKEGISQAKKQGVKRLEAWSIEEGAKEFYEKFGFKRFFEYHHVLIDKREKLRPLDENGMHITELYAHVMPDTDINDIMKKYAPKEVHICAGFELSV